MTHEDWIMLALIVLAFLAGVLLGWASSWKLMSSKLLTRKDPEDEENG